MRKVLLLLFCFLFLKVSFAQITYDYPIKPGSDKWKELTTHDQKVEVLQLPVNLLNGLKTKDLLTICLNYPLFPDMWAFNSLQNGFENVKNNFNGLQELFNRTDLVEVMFSHYISLKPEQLQHNLSSLEKIKISFKYSMFEILLSQPELLDRLNNQQKETLLKLANLQIIKKQNFKNQFSKTHLEVNYALLGRIIEKLDNSSVKMKYNKNKNLQHFIKNASNPSHETVSDINEITQNILNKK